MSKRTKQKKTDGSGSSGTTKDSSVQPGTEVEPNCPPTLVIRHLRIGWWSLLLFLTLGIALEAMHGFKLQWYLGEQNATRRLMFTLAHVHGTLLSLIHLGFAASNYIATTKEYKRGEMIRSWLLSLATILIPVGFFSGGWQVYDGDPSLGILLVPVGAACLFTAVLLQAISLRFHRETVTRN